DDARRHRRRDGATLVLPVLALAEQQATTGDRAENADRGGGAAVVARVLDQDVMDRLRRVEQHLRPPERAAFDHIAFVGVVRPHQQRIGADGREERPQGRHLARVVGARRDGEGLVGHAAALALRDQEALRDQDSSAGASNDSTAGLTIPGRSRCTWWLARLADAPLYRR